MAGVGKLLKQAKKMQDQMEALQSELAQKEIEVSSGGGAIIIKVNGQGEFLNLQIDEAFLKEEKTLVEETLLDALQQAQQQAKAYNDAQMSKVTAGLNIPGMGGGLQGLF